MRALTFIAKHHFDKAAVLVICNLRFAALSLCVGSCLLNEGATKMGTVRQSNILFTTTSYACEWRVRDNAAE
jgi:hypothetical protein